MDINQLVDSPLPQFASSPGKQDIDVHNEEEQPGSKKPVMESLEQEEDEDDEEDFEFNR